MTAIAIAITGMGLTGLLRMTWVQDNLAHLLDHSHTDETSGTPGQVAGPSASRRSPGPRSRRGRRMSRLRRPGPAGRTGTCPPIDWRGAESFTDIPRRSVSPCRWTKRRGRPSLGPV